MRLRYRKLRFRLRGRGALTGLSVEFPTVGGRPLTAWLVVADLVEA